MLQNQIRESLSIVEIQAGDKKTENGRITLPSAMMEMVKSTLPSNLKAQLRFSGAIVDKLERKMNTVNYHDVINQTKNKLLDILLELESEFPNLENDYIMNDSNNEKANSIVTTNIYGGNAPVNIATGNNNNQTITLSIENIDYEKLKSFDIEDKEIEDLKVILDRLYFINT